MISTSRKKYKYRLVSLWFYCNKSSPNLSCNSGLNSRRTVLSFFEVLGVRFVYCAQYKWIPCSTLTSLTLRLFYYVVNQNTSRPCGQFFLFVGFLSMKTNVLKRKNYLLYLTSAHGIKNTVCPRSLDPFYILSRK